jgi:FAD synthase
MGIDHLLVLPFTEEFSQMSSEEFIGKILVDKIQTKTLVIGYDHRFGKNREGSFEYLQSHSHLSVLNWKKFQDRMSMNWAFRAPKSGLP